MSLVGALMLVLGGFSIAGGAGAQGESYGVASLALDARIDGADLSADDAAVFTEGDALVLSWAVTNTGSMDLRAITVNDSLLGEVCVVELLPVGQSASCEADDIALVPGAVARTASAAGSADSADFALGEDQNHYEVVAAPIEDEVLGQTLAQDDDGDSDDASEETTGDESTDEATDSTAGEDSADDDEAGDTEDGTADEGGSTDDGADDSDDNGSAADDSTAEDDDADNGATDGPAELADTGPNADGPATIALVAAGGGLILLSLAEAVRRNDELHAAD